MKSINKILVALDLTSTDENLIKYASFLSEKLGPGKIYFVHNIKKYEISELFQEQLKELNLEDIISAELEEKVTKHFSAKQVETEVLISEDPYTESLINYIVHKYGIDLVMLGNKSEEKGSGVVSEKLMRLLKCDVLSIPENSSEKLEHIWTGTDFSRESVKAFELAEEIRKSTNATLTAAHVYNIPVQFTPYLDKEKMIPKIEKHTIEKFRKFLDRNKIDNAEMKVIRGLENSVAHRLSIEAEKAKSDILIVGDKGGNVFSSLMVGSVTDELFDRPLNIPLWIAK